MRSFSLIKAVGPSLYIAYLRNTAPGPFPITAPFAWPGRDRNSLKAVMEDWIVPAVEDFLSRTPETPTENDATTEPILSTPP